MERFQNTVGGRQAESRAWFESFDPYTGKPWALISSDCAAEVDAAVAAARAVFRSPAWAGLTASARGKLLLRLADLIAANADRLAALETRDNGKLIAEMRAQLRNIPEWFRCCGGLADKIEGAVLPIDKPGMFAFTRSEPLGVVATIVP